MASFFCIMKLVKTNHSFSGGVIMIDIMIICAVSGAFIGGTRSVKKQLRGQRNK